MVKIFFTDTNYLILTNKRADEFLTSIRKKKETNDEWIVINESGNTQTVIQKSHIAFFTIQNKEDSEEQNQYSK